MSVENNKQRKKCLIGKFGKSILFNKSRWGLIGGDAAPYLLFLFLAKRYPECDFYLLGKSDFSKLKDRSEMPENIFDLWKDFNPKDKIPYSDWPLKVIQENNLKFDFGLFFCGPVGYTNIKGKNVLLKDPTQKAKVLEMFEKYSGPMMHALNELQIPYFTICEDPKYAPMQCRDLFNVEKFSLAQYDKNYTSNRIKSYEENSTLEKRESHYRYAGVETIFLLGEEKIDFRTINKDIKMSLILNEGMGKAKGRGEIVEEWILSKDPNVPIYGKWHAEWMEKYPGNFQPVKLKDMEDEVWRTRYTFIIPIMKHWVTSKFWKMIHYGVIPFFHPYYDTQKHLDVPEFLRPKTPEEMWERIAYLEKYPAAREKLLEKFWHMLEDEYYSGHFLGEVFDKAIQEIQQ